MYITQVFNLYSISLNLMTTNNRTDATNNNIFQQKCSFQIFFSKWISDLRCEMKVFDLSELNVIKNRVASLQKFDKSTLGLV